MRHRIFSALTSTAIAAGFWAGPAPLDAQQFGGAMAAGDDIVLISEFNDERRPGTVYVYAPADGGWAEQGTLTAPGAHPGDRFGRSLALDGTTLVVGSTALDDASRGIAFVYEWADGAWTEQGRLVPDDLADGDAFGRTVAVDGDRLLASTMAQNESRGAVYVYEREDGAWTQTGKLIASDGAAEDVFGAAVALDGDLAVVGAPGRGENAGAAYVFEYADGTWTEIGALDPSVELGENIRFGWSVGIAEDEVLVAALGVDRTRGTVFRFAESGDAWTVAGRITPPEELEAPAGFGMSLDASGDHALIGAAFSGAGFAYLYEEEGGEWELVRTFETDLPTRSQFGTAVALGHDVAAVGAPAVDFGAGTAFIFDDDSERMTRVQPEQVGLDPIAGGQVDCAEGMADQFDCEQVDLLSFIPREAIGAGRGARLNDVWGWTDPETGAEIAIVGRMDGTAFVDVSDPYNPRYLGNLDKTPGSTPNTWRDMKVYNDHVFVVADGAGEHGMQVFDLRQLRDVTEPQEFEPTALYTGIHSSHNIVINEETGFAYAVGSSGGAQTCGGGLHMIDIREPSNPTFAGCFAHENTGRRGTGYSHDAQCVIYHGPDEDWTGREICVGANETAISIADVTDKDNPVPISQFTYPNVAYAHQGWFTDDHRYFYSNDEADELSGLVEKTRTLVWDLTDLDDPTLVQEYMSPTKVTDHNLYVDGDRLFMSNNRAGLRVLDISDPANPEEAGSFDTTPWSGDEAGFDGTWSVYPYFESGIILLSSRREGLFVVKAREQRLVP